MSAERVQCPACSGSGADHYDAERGWSRCSVCLGSCNVRVDHPLVVEREKRRAAFKARVAELQQIRSRFPSAYDTLRAEGAL